LEWLAKRPCKPDAELVLDFEADVERTDTHALRANVRAVQNGPPGAPMASKDEPQQELFPRWDVLWGPAIEATVVEEYWTRIRESAGCVPGRVTWQTMDFKAKRGGQITHLWLRTSADREQITAFCRELCVLSTRLCDSVGLARTEHAPWPFRIQSPSDRNKASKRRKQKHASDPTAEPQ